MKEQVTTIAAILGFMTMCAFVVLSVRVFLPSTVAMVRARHQRWLIRNCTSFEVMKYSGTVYCNCGQIAFVRVVGRRFEIEYTSCPLWLALKNGEVRQMRLLPP